VQIMQIKLPGQTRPTSTNSEDNAERRFRNIEVDLPWAPAVVLFGRNDAGKSNILTQVSDVFDPPDWVTSPPAAGTVALVFDGADHDDSWDAHFLAELIQYKDARFYFHPGLIPSGGSVERVLLIPDGLGADVRVTLGTEAQQLTVIRERLKGQLLAHAAPSCEDWVAVVRYFEAALDACLGFRRIVARLHPEEDAWFAAPFPSPDDLTALTMQALSELALRREVWREGRIPFVEPLLADDASEDVDQLFFEIGAIRGGFSPYKVVRLGADAPDPETFAEKVTSEIIDGFGVAITEFKGEFPGLRDYIGPNDWWFHREEEFDRIEDAWVRISPVVVAICREISSRATDLAPRFIRDDYIIHVIPLPPDQVGEKTRLAVILATRRSPNGEGQAFDISDVSSGIALWATYSILETIRRLVEQLLEVIRTPSDTLAPLADVIPGLSFLADLPSEPADEPVLAPEDREREKRARAIHAEAIRNARTDLVFTQRTLYVIDEPERHLHPLAQGDVARWVAALAQEAGADVLVASHASPFLNLPTTLAEYILVTRDEHRITRSVAVSADVIGRLDRVAEDAGLSRADLL
jgi:hypothetical protein